MFLYNEVIKYLLVDKLFYFIGILFEYIKILI